ncbi:MAG: LysR family transcriptional regulator [Pirellulaceae bacterium]|nr:LysR family transcriptional regulator [Pirellulaceae bacterium]
MDVGTDLEAASQADWKGVIDGESLVPGMVVVSCDGGRVRTRMTDCGPGVHLSGKGWNETKNAIFVSAKSETSDVDPEPIPPDCFFDPTHVAQLTEMAKTKENSSSSEDLPEQSPKAKKIKSKRRQPKHKPKRIHRTIISSMKNSTEFGQQMAREANRRNFGQAMRKAFVADGLPCNWTIYETHFSDYVPILDFVHAVTYVYRATLICFGKCDEAWTTYTQWMTQVWKGQVGDVISDLMQHQQRIGFPPETVSDDDPRERLRLIIGYLKNNQKRMKYNQYRCQGLPTTSAWMESAVKEINYRVKGTEMFWNHPDGAEAILQIRAASLCDDDRLVRLMTHRPGCATVRRSASNSSTAA